MPVVTVEASKKLTKECKMDLIKEVSQTVADEYNIPVETITMIIRENNPENIGLGGKPVSEKH